MNKKSFFEYFIFRVVSYAATLLEWVWGRNSRRRNILGGAPFSFNITGNNAIAGKYAIAVLYRIIAGNNTIAGKYAIAVL